MEALFGRVLSFFKQTNGTAHTQPDILQRLPTELIILICSHLSCVDIACLALCCHASLFKIGRASLLFSSQKSKTATSERNYLPGSRGIFRHIISAIVVSVFMSGRVSRCHGHRIKSLGFDARIIINFLRCL